MFQIIQNPILETEPGVINFPTGFLQAFLPKLLTIALVVASVVFLFVLLLAGLSWMTAGGDKAQVEGARARLTNALIGLFIVFTIFAFAQVIEVLFGIDILTLDIEKLIVQ